MKSKEAGWSLLEDTIDQRAKSRAKKDGLCRVF
jgi:hypothetical protein